MSNSERVPLLHGGKQERNPSTYVSLSGEGNTDIDKPITGSEELKTGDVYDSVSLNEHQKKLRRSRSVLDVIDPISLSWENVNVHVKAGRRKFFQGASDDAPLKHILRNVNGLVKPGTLTAILGASGAGKSTLMNVITGRNVAQYIVDGDIKVNGVTVGRGIKNISAYVQQDDLFIGTLTVREHLVFRGLLRMDKSLDKIARLQRVEEVILEMGLSKCAETMIGSPGGKKGISGGEMKRLSFASEVLTNPPLMFCDEPTSGLDTFMAQSIVQTLQKMAMKGRTILCTIHQPSSEVFALFNEVLLMAEGRVAFMGPSEDAFTFFEEQGYLCPNKFNPADFYILTLAIVPGKEEECRGRVESLCDAFDNSETNVRMAEDTRTVTQKCKDEVVNTSLFENVFGDGNDRYKASWIKQFRTVFWRSWIGVFRDVMLFRVRVGQTLAVAMLLGLIYLRQSYDQAGVMNINGALFLFIINMSFTNMFSVLNTFPLEVGIFLREYGSGLYRVDVYYIAKTFAELPSFVFLPIVFISVVYWMVGMYDSWQAFLICAGMMVLVGNIAVSFGYVISTLCASVNIALSVAPPILIPFMMFGGFFLNNASVPDYFIWLQYLSWFKYSNEVLAVNQWQNVDHIDCNVGNGTMPNGTIPSGEQRCFRNGNEVISSLNFSKDNIRLDIALLATLLVGYRIFSFTFLYVRARRSKA